MIKTMTISIEVSGETEGDANGAIETALNDIYLQRQWYSTRADGRFYSGHCDKGEETMHWSYEIKTNE